MSSTLPLPELWSAENEPVQLHVTHLEKIPVFEVIQKEGWISEDFLYVQLGPQGILLHIKDVCRVWYKSSDTLVIEPNAGIDLEEVKVYLLGSGLALYLMNQGQFALHAGTVTDGTHSLSFMGDSGMGKSTTCTYFLDQGYRLLADDVSLVQCSTQNVPGVWPAHPSLKLWPDALNQLHRDPVSLPQVFQNENKYRLSARHNFSAQGNIPLKAIFLLAPDEAVEQAVLTRLQGKDCFDAIANNIYRTEAVSWLGQTANHFRFCTKLAQQVPVFRLQRPTESFDLEAIFQRVVQTMASL